MPIHFSIGFVVEQNPRPQYDWICVEYLDSIQVDAVIHDVIDINAVWDYEGVRC